MTVENENLRLCCLCMSRFGLLRYCMALVRGLASCDDLDILLIVAAEERGYVEDILTRLPAQHKDKITVQYVKLLGTKNRALVPLRITRLVKSYKPDAIHDPVGIAFTMGFAVWPILSRMAPLFITFHDPKPHHGMGNTLWSRFRRHLIRSVPHKVVLHGATNAEKALEYGISRNKIVVSEHGMLNQFSDFPATGEDGNSVLFFGQLRPNKGMDLLREIALQVQQKVPDFKLIVAGKRPEGLEFQNSGWTEEVGTILEKLRKIDFVEIHDGFVSDENAARLFHRSSVVILPYRDGSQSGVLFIAIALHKVIVLTEVGELANTALVYGGGKTSKYDATQFADALILALTTERASLRQRIMDNQQRTTDTYSFPAIARKLVEEYRSTRRKRVI